MICHDDSVRVWFKKDDQFWVPKANIKLFLRSPVASVTPMNTIMIPADSAKLECLREVDYDTDAPRPNGRVPTAIPEVLAQIWKYAKVPLIIGNQENERTVFALYQSSITTEAALTSHLNGVFFQNATRDEIAGCSHRPIEGVGWWEVPDLSNSFTLIARKAAYHKLPHTPSLT
ncbi:secreted lipase-like protein 5 [Botrytis cinerea]